MERIRIAFTLRKDEEESTELEIASAFALVCQDETREYAVMAGPAAVLRELYCWGMVNFGIASPLPELVSAVDRVLRPAIGSDAARVIVRNPADLPSAAAPGALSGPWTMDVRITFENGEKLVLAGMTDLVLMLTDEHGERKVATGGSGMQKGKLIELGVRELFGPGTHEAFIMDFRGEEPPVIRKLRERALAMTRNGPRTGNGVTVAAIDVKADDEE